MVHEISEQTCEICGKVYKDTTNFNNHMKGHDKSNESTCELCGKVFPTLIALTEHRKYDNSHIFLNSLLFLQNCPSKDTVLSDLRWNVSPFTKCRGAFGTCTWSRTKICVSTLSATFYTGMGLIQYVYLGPTGRFCFRKSCIMLKVNIVSLKINTLVPKFVTVYQFILGIENQNNFNPFAQSLGCENDILITFTLLEGKHYNECLYAVQISQLIHLPWIYQ